jgi:hypothetical protein
MEINELNEDTKRKESTTESMDHSLQMFQKKDAVIDPSHDHHQPIITTNDSNNNVIGNSSVSFTPFQTEDSSDLKSQESHRPPSHTRDAAAVDDDDDEEEKEVVEGSFAADQRLIESERTKTTANAKADLEDVLNRIHDVTNTLLQEMSGFLESISEVELDYVKVLKSQQAEKTRLENVVPDITDTTSILL